VLGRPALVPVPAAALRLVLGEMADRTLLSSARVVPERLAQSGYRFRFPDLEGALRSMLRPRERSKFPQ
jgi:NAD dependent epimerase/dehydratase family enzyme